MREGLTTKTQLNKGDKITISLIDGKETTYLVGQNKYNVLVSVDNEKQSVGRSAVNCLEDVRLILETKIINIGLKNRGIAFGIPKVEDIFKYINLNGEKVFDNGNWLIPVGDKWPEHEGFYLDLVKEGDTISILQANENGEYCGEYNCTGSISEFKEFINKINNSGKAVLELLISIFKDISLNTTEDDYKRILRPENSVRKVDVNGRTVYRDGVWFLK